MQTFLMMFYLNLILKTVGTIGQTAEAIVTGIQDLVLMKAITL